MKYLRIAVYIPLNFIIYTATVSQVKVNIGYNVANFIVGLFATKTLQESVGVIVLSSCVVQCKSRLKLNATS